MNDQSLLFPLPPSSPASLPILSHPQVRLVVALYSLEYTALRPAQQIVRDECKGGWRVGCRVVRESQRITKDSDATQDIGEGKKVKIQHTDNHVLL